MSAPLDALVERTLDELVKLADDAGIPKARHPWRDGLIASLADHDSPGEAYGCGVLETHAEGFGFLRSPFDDLLPGDDDIYVSQSQIKRFDLRTGDTVVGRIRPPKEAERYAALLRVELVNGEPPDAGITPFEQLDAVYPSTRLPLARDPWLAAVDWVSPLGLGARGLLIGPSRTERTELLRRTAAAFAGDERVEVCALLLGARPEDVTEWRETVPVEVLATPVDELPARHLHVADIAFERARRLAERGIEVILLVDSLTRLYRHAAAEASNGHVVDGLDAGALLKLRRWFSTGRDLRDAGSVTLMATLDDGQDPLSAALLRDLGDIATWQLALRPTTPGTHTLPSIDVPRSWTRREERLVPDDELATRRRWRLGLQPDGSDTDEALVKLFRPTPMSSNQRTGS